VVTPARASGTQRRKQQGKRSHQADFQIKEQNIGTEKRIDE
jgi:hypothetical protein